MLTEKSVAQAITETPQTNWSISLFSGGSIGFLAGIVGIGGGIFLAPILYFLKWGTEKQIAVACCLFIFTNSISGLVGQLSKVRQSGLLDLALPYWPLILAVFIGGQIGSFIATKKLNSKGIRTLTALLILYVSLRLLFVWYELLIIIN